MDATGEAAITGTTVCRCQVGVYVFGKATMGEGCRITDNRPSGIIVSENSPGEVTVEAGAVCEGNFEGAHSPTSPRSSSNDSVRFLHNPPRGKK